MSRPVTVAAILLGLGLVVTPGFSGHASVSGAVALVADAAHVQAAAVWVGGLAFVVAALAGVATLWMAVLADTGASIIVIANALRLLRAD